MRRCWRPDWIDDDDVTQTYYDDRAAEYMPELPPVDASAVYLVNYLLEVGPTVAAGMGAGPITFGEMAAWSRLTAVALSSHDARLLRRLSGTYLNESHKATENFYPPPWWPEGDAAELQAAEGIPKPLTKAEVESERQKRMAGG